ncbi:MAG: DUF86 domain-containing protein [Candidatus Bathyarchaeota archaeon]|nr:DUF86 domain-containing protein [Candidatus Bathyarchaeota archaeon]
MLYLKDILEAIERIESYVKGCSFEQFAKNTLIIDAVVRNFEIIGEATKHLPLEIKQENPSIRWKDMAGMRDKLAHEYFGVDIDILWKTSVNRLPALKSQIEELLRKDEENEL